MDRSSGPPEELRGLLEACAQERHDLLVYPGVRVDLGAGAVDGPLAEEEVPQVALEGDEAVRVGVRPRARHAHPAEALNAGKGWDVAPPILAHHRGIPNHPGPV